MGPPSSWSTTPYLRSPSSSTEHVGFSREVDCSFNGRLPPACAELDATPPWELPISPARGHGRFRRADPTDEVLTLERLPDPRSKT
jgi:hypothetical protein